MGILMKERLLLMFWCVFAYACKTTAKDAEKDEIFIRTNLKEFPNNGFYLKRNWQLVNGYRVDNMISMQLTFSNGDTIIECSLEKDFNLESDATRRELNVVISQDTQRQIIRNINETDTIYNFFRATGF